jgi:transcriptional regulator with XRE-family HTH domain
MPTAVSSLIRTARLDRGLTQRELAKLARTSQPAIARLEKGSNSPSVATLERVLGGLGLRLEIEARSTDTGVDRTLIAQALRATAEERVRRVAQAARGIEEMRRAFIASTQP